MKIVSLNSFAIFMSITMLISLSNTPPVESGPAASLLCILTCAETACAAAAALCLPLGGATGPLAIPAAIACFLASGGPCAACVSACVAVGALPITA